MSCATSRFYRSVPTFVGNEFGLNQASGGLQFTTGDMLGGQELTAWGIVGKNMRNATDLNTDVGFFYERRLRPQVGNNRTFNPSFFIAGRRREIDNLLKDRLVAVDTLAASDLYPVPVDSVTSLLIPAAEQYVYQATSRQDLFKTALGQLAVGVDVPLTRRTELNALYLWRNYAESWTLRRFRSQNQIYLVQDGVDVSAVLDPALLGQDTLLVDSEDPLSFYDDLSFFRTHMLSTAWRYRKINPTADRLISPSGRAMALVYRYLMPTVADSLTEQTPTDGVPRDQFVGVERGLRVNEYIAAYNERIGLPFDNSLNIELIGAYKKCPAQAPLYRRRRVFGGPLLLAAALLCRRAQLPQRLSLFHRLGDQIALRPHRLRVSDSQAHQPPLYQLQLFQALRRAIRRSWGGGQLLAL